MGLTLGIPASGTRGKDKVNSIARPHNSPKRCLNLCPFTNPSTTPTIHLRDPAEILTSHSNLPQSFAFLQRVACATLWINQTAIPLSPHR